MSKIEPGYLALYKSGELERSAARLEARLASCDICPRECGKNRLEGQTGFCHSGAIPIVSSFCAHHGEEPALSGTRGSGTIFFGNCNMRCVYCQNHQISQDHRTQRRNEIDGHTLAEHMLYLQDDLKCHNINLVSPSHFVPQIVRALVEAVPMGLKLPLVYNTGGYDSVETLKDLDGIIDIYLPDLRYASDKWARKFSRARNYVESARAAIKEMYRQVGNLVVDDEEIAVKGIIVRHLILPGGLAGSEESLEWLVREVSPSVTVSIMSQYYPANRVQKYPILSRKILPGEYDEVVRLVEKLGIEGWTQEMASAESYIPDFSKDKPFSDGGEKQIEEE
jgi:putative pyruvate formate lyase activating enzyme